MLKTLGFWKTVRVLLFAVLRLRIRIRMGSYQSERKDSHPDPHQSDELDPDPHEFADGKPRKCMQY
jgi:hypothetical protein